MGPDPRVRVPPGGGIPRRSSGYSAATQSSNVPPNPPGGSPCSASRRASQTVVADAMSHVHVPSSAASNASMSRCSATDVTMSPSSLIALSPREDASPMEPRRSA